MDFRAEAAAHFTSRVQALVRELDQRGTRDEEGIPERAVINPASNESQLSRNAESGQCLDKKSFWEAVVCHAPSIILCGGADPVSYNNTAVPFTGTGERITSLRAARQVTQDQRIAQQLENAQRGGAGRSMY